MSPVDHRTTINITSELVRSQGQPYPTMQSIHQSVCVCGWKGPRRLRLWEAEDDSENHKKYVDS